MQLSLLFGKELIVIIVSYVLGCFSTGYYLIRLRTGQDIRKLGSGSTGGTNVGRVLGKPGFALTMLGDFLKGAIAYWLAMEIGVEAWARALVIFAVVAGHVFPVQLGFHGGKGLATVLGAALLFDYRFTIVIIALTGLLGVLSRQFALSLMLVIAIAPLIAALIGHTPAEAVGLGITALLILFAHRTNILSDLKQIRNRTQESM